MLRSLLASLTASTPTSLTFEKSAHGKPFLALPDGPAFNLSHARGYSLIAISGAGDIGCDIEDRFTHDDVMSVCAPVLHSSELQAMQRLAAHEWQAAFESYWVRKEAALKAAGLGFLRDPRAVVTGLDQAHPQWVGDPGPHVFIHNRRIDGECVAAVASLDAACDWRLLVD